MYGRVVLAMALAMALRAGLYGIVPTSALHEDVPGTAAYLEVVGALYSITVAFLIFVVWGQFNEVQMGIAREGAALEDLCMVAGLMTTPGASTEVRGATTQYLSATTGD